MNEDPNNSQPTSPAAPATPVTEVPAATPVATTSEAGPTCAKCGMASANGECSGCNQGEGDCACPVNTQFNAQVI